MNAMQPVVVDARGLDHPEPMERILAALANLEPGQQVLFKIHREPYPLYRILEQNHYEWKLSKKDDGSFEILIREA